LGALAEKIKAGITKRLINHHVSTVILLFVLAYCLAYILPLGERPLSAPDEPRYAEIPREILVTGDWVVPHLVGLRYFEKPVLGYWLSAVSLSLFGENNFAVRLPSALAVGLSAWLIWLLMIRSGYSRNMALISAGVFLTFFETLILGTVALLDTPFTLFLTAGMVLFYLATECINNKARQWRYLSGSGVMLGLAFLTKGFLAFVLPAIVFLPFILIRKQYNLLWRSAWIMLFALLTILPWAIAIHIREPDFWHYFIWEEHIRRFLEPNAQHASPVNFYLVALPILIFPWFGFLPAAIAGYRQKIQNLHLNWFLVLWFLIPFIFFSTSKGKLVTYILPCLIPAAILIATGLMNYLQTNKHRWFILGVIINTATLGLLFFILLYHEFFSASAPLYSQIELPMLIAMLVSLVIAATMMLATAFVKEKFTRITLILCSTLILLPAVNLFLPVGVLKGKSPSYITNSIVDKIDDNTIFVSDVNSVHSVAWIYKRTDIYLLSSGELTYGLKYPGEENRLLGMKGLEMLLNKQQAGEVKKDIAVFCEEPCSGSLTSLLKHRAEKISNNKFAVWIIRFAK